MTRRKIIGIITAAVLVLIAAIVWLMRQPDEVNGEATTESEEESYSVSVTETIEPTVQESSEETITETDDSEETETIEEVVESETEDIHTEYYCYWADVEFTEADMELILTTVFCESGGETYEEQYMVALTILNQITSGEFGNTVRKVIYRKNNFSVTNWRDFENRGWSESVYNAVMQALKENPHPRDMYYFRTGHYHKWAKNYKHVGKFYFSTDK